MNANTEKGISLVIFFLTTMVAGTIPILLFSRCQERVTSRRGQAIISHLNCFAGGVFLATCLLNLLVEGFEEYEEYRVAARFDIEYPFFHLGIGAGFFLVAFVERFAFFLSKENTRVRENDTWEIEGIKLKCFGNGRKDSTHERVELTGTDTIMPAEPPAGSHQSESVFAIAGSRSVLSQNGATSDALNQRSTDMKDITEKCRGHTGVITIAIFLALSFHTVFDGLAVGLLEKESDIWTTTAAICIHKTIVAISLGLELATSLSRKPWKAFLLLFVFALIAPLGVGIGMGVTSNHMDLYSHLLSGSILQGVATGSFMYVTFFEVLGEELGHNSSVLKIVFTMVGFGAMAVAKIWDTD